MFFDNWFGLVRVVVVGSLAYVALIIFLRTSGKRTLAKMNAFDLVVTVALGSTLATITLTQDVALFEGVLALSLLISLQFVITWLSVRSEFIRGLIKSEPTLLLYQGQLLGSSMRRQRVTKDEVLAALRQQNLAGLEQAHAVVLETDGTISVIPSDGGSESALTGVEKIDNRWHEQ